MAGEDSPEARRRKRLSKSGEFDRVYRQGSSNGDRFLVLYSFGGADGTRDGEIRLGVSVGRKVGKAVQRNKVKRTIREAFWELGDRLSADHDYVVVARPGAHELVKREGTEGIRRSLEELLERAHPKEGV